MNKLKQRTVKNDVSFNGIGLHTGCQVNCILKPAAVNTGLQFVRTDLPGNPVIKVDPSNIRIDTDIPRCTTIGHGEAVIHTVEHLMSVLSSLKISNLTIEIDAKEVPGLDGSGLEFLEKIKSTGIADQEADQEVYKIIEPIGVELNGCSIFMVPADDFKISYTLNYNHSFLKTQYFSQTITDESYENEIAPSRTFCLEQEANELKSKGLGQGANYKNTLVVGDQGVIDNTLRFEDEFARHKVLDFIGDLYLLGLPIRGHVFCVKSGHTLNVALLQKIYKQRERFLRKTSVSAVNFEGQKEIDIKGIMSILPHRYPFLLVDRVIEIEKGKRAVGIKNVTINDDFFRGHFPTRPVMPGVLMVEAMAQTAGVVVLTNEAHHGKVAFFMAVDKVKFRKVVSPGDQLLMEVEVVKDKSRTAQIRAVSRVGDTIVAEAEMIFSFTDASFLNE